MLVPLSSGLLSLASFDGFEGAACSLVTGSSAPGLHACRSVGSSSSTDVYRGRNWSTCLFQHGPRGQTLTLYVRDPLTLVTIAGTHLGSFSRLGPQYKAYTADPVLNLCLGSGTAIDAVFVAGCGFSISILVRICLLWRSSLGENPLVCGVLLCC